MPFSAAGVRIRAIPLCAFSFGVVAALDAATGSRFGFFVFYFVPIGLAALWLGRAPALLVAAAAASTWYLIDAQLGAPSPHRVWNAGIRLASFVVVAAALSAIRSALTRERELNRQLSEALANLRRLRGLLPICASCKSIRNDAGYWEELEAYVSSHSEATFTHGFCPKCLERLFGELQPPGGERPEARSREIG